MENNPKVSIIMSVYNTELYIKETIESILSQTYKNFEFLIIDNASTDSTAEIIKNYNDSRIKLFENETNLGYVPNLNRLLKLASGKYIARQDGDDISLPYRIEKQVEFMETHPNVCVCGSSAIVFGHKRGKLIGELDNKEIKTAMLFENQIVNSSALMRTEIVKDMEYDINYIPVEDYKFWFEIQKKYEIANIKEPLVKYRTHKNNFGSQKRDLQEINILKIQKEMLNYYFIYENPSKCRNLEYYELIKENVDIENKVIEFDVEIFNKRLNRIIFKLVLLNKEMNFIKKIKKLKKNNILKFNSLYDIVSFYFVRHV